jgi:hypothetical protein
MTNRDSVPLHLISGQHVVISAFDDVPEHTFEVFTVEDGFVTGVALTGPLAGEYGEPDNEMILRVIST